MKSTTLIFVVLSTALVGRSSGFLFNKGISLGICPPKPPTVSTLNVEEYLGRWYQMQGIPTFFSPSGSSCIAANYGLNANGTISVRNSMIDPKGTYEEICGYAEQVDPVNNPGDLVVRFPRSPPGTYLLIGTDYNSFASVYSCSDVLGIVKLEFGWVLTRDPVPNAEAISKGRQAFIDLGLDISKFENIPQSDQVPCIFEPPNGQPNCL